MSGRHVEVVALTHPGAQREGNEDSLVIGPFTAVGATMGSPVRWSGTISGSFTVAVADGMGGHAAGKVASARTVQELALTPPDAAGSGGEQRGAVLADLRRIDAALTSLAQSAAELSGMGTTVAGVALSPTGDAWFNVGDSRVYQQWQGALAQLSEDDAVVSPRGRRDGGGALTQWLGERSATRRLDPHVGVLGARTDQRWLICSDGLTDLVDDESIEAILNPERDPCAAVTDLFAAAMTASGRDNVSIILVSAGAPEGSLST